MRMSKKVNTTMHKYCLCSVVNVSTHGLWKAVIRSCRIVYGQNMTHGTYFHLILSTRTLKVSQ